MMKPKYYVLTFISLIVILSIAIFNNATENKNFNIERQKAFDGNTYQMYVNFYDDNNNLVETKFVKNVGETFSMSAYDLKYANPMYEDLPNQISFHYSSDNITTTNYKKKYSLYNYFTSYTEVPSSNYSHDFSLVDSNNVTRYYSKQTKSHTWPSLSITEFYDPRVYGVDYIPPSGETIYVNAKYRFENVAADMPSTPSKDGYYFAGWFNDLNQRVNYLNKFLYGYSGYRDFMLDTIDRNLYAEYRSADEIICKRGKKLHTETCNRDSGGCYDSGYYDEGSMETTTITYGNLGTSGELHTGDIFTCDVNNDGIYDEDTERFYYVSDYFNTSSNSFENDKAVLIYYSNTTINGPTNSSSKDYFYSVNSSAPIYPYNQFMYCSNENNYYSCDEDSDYTYVMSGFPRRWKTYLINDKRHIYGTYGSKVNDSYYSLKSYEKNSSNARLLTFQEFLNNCGVTFQASYTPSGNLDSCNFLFENTSYADSSVTATSYWLETAKGSNYNDAWTVNSNSRTIETLNFQSKSGSRPVIEMYKTNMEINFDDSTKTITIGDGEPISVAAKSEYVLPSVPSKADEDVNITLKYSLDNVVTTLAYTRQYVQNGWIVNSDEYYNKVLNAGDTIIVTSDVTLTPRYIETVIDNNFTFPNIPNINEYTATNVTFKYQDGETSDATKNITVSASATKWKSNRAEYSPGDTYDGNVSMEFRPDYVYPGGALENPVRDGYVFIGWYDAAQNGNLITKNNLKSNMTLYAYWEIFETGKKCVRTDRVLKTWLYDYDYSDGNYTFLGNFGVNGELNAGDIIFCDIDGNGNYSGTGTVGGYHELFYYISDYYNTETQSFENDTAVLIGENEAIPIDGTYGEKYNKSHSLMLPNKIIESLTTKNRWSNWTNVSLKNTNRQLLTNNNTNITKDTSGNLYKLKQFEYANTNIRLLTYQELAQACEINDPYYQVFSNDYSANISLKHCNFLNQTFWLETQNADLSEYALRVQNGHVDSEYVNSTSIIRPTIDVDKDDIQMYFNDYEHTITIEGLNEEVTQKLGVSHGSFYTLPENNYTFDTDGEEVITYVYQYEDRSDEVRTYYRHHSANGWLINGSSSSNVIGYSDWLLVMQDITLTPNISYSHSSFDMPEPNRYGYRFDGWYTEADGGELVDNIEDLEDRTLYAHWTRVYDLYNYDGNYEQVEYGTTITLPEDDDGYNNFIREFEYLFDYNYDDAPEAEFVNVTTYGEFVGWNINGGDYESGDEYTIISNTEVYGVYEGQIDESTLPNIPERDGYAFVGWYTDPENGKLVDLANMSEEIYWNMYDYDMGNFSLYAHWIEYDSETQVLVNWDGNIYIYEKGTTVDLDIDDNKQYDEVLARVQLLMQKQAYSDINLDITKTYTRDHYLINGDVHEATGEYTFNEDTTIKSVYNSEISYPDVPEFDYENFYGFYDDSTNEQVTSLVGVYTNKTYYGRWKKVNVYIDGELKWQDIDVGVREFPYNYKNMSKYLTFVYKGATIPRLEKVSAYIGYEFDYFTVDGDDSVKYYQDELYDYEEDTYLISHYKFNGNYSGSEDFMNLVNNNFDLGRVENFGSSTNYYLKRWSNTSSLDEGEEYDFRTGAYQLIDKECNYWSPCYIYAQWEEVPENVNVTINDSEPYVQEFGEHQLIPNDKEVSTTKADDTFNITFDYNDGTNNRVVNQVTRNYTFNCFSVDGAGCYQRDDNYTFYQDTSINSEYTVIYDYSDIEIPDNSAEKFRGWFTKPSGGYEITDPSQLEDFTEDTIIYAQYYTGTVHLNVDGVETDVPRGTIYTFEEVEPFDKTISLTLDYNQDGIEDKILNYTATYTAYYFDVQSVHDYATMYPGDVYLLEDDTMIETYYNSSVDSDFVGYSDYAWDIGMRYYDSEGLENELVYWETRVCNSGGGEGGGDGPKSTRNSPNTLYGRDPGGLVEPGLEDPWGNDCWTDYVDFEYIDFDSIQEGQVISAVWEKPEAIVYYYDPIDDTNLDTSWSTVGGTINWLPDYYTKDGYYFDGWYTDDTYTERVDYDYVIKVSNLTLYGHWVEDTREDPEKSLIIKPDETTLEVEKGTIYDLGTNDISKEDDNIAEVYFVTEYYDEEAPPVYTTDYVKKRYTPNGWLVNGNYYSNLESIDCQDDIIVIRPYYDIELISPDFSEPTKDNYTFAGWYDHPETGIQYTEYIGSEDMPLFARWVGAEISVTKPDNTIEIYHYGDEYDLGTNDIAKADENGASVTFKYQDGREDTISYVTKSFTPDKWKVNDVEYDNDEVLTLTEDIVIEATYLEDTVELVFEDPVREHYTFDGWYDDATNGNLITSYDGYDDINVYAHWTGEAINVTKPDNTVEVKHYGDIYNLGTNESEKASENLGLVTFKYLDDRDDTSEYVKRVYTASGWLVNGEELPNNQDLVLTEDITITYNYTDSIQAVEFEEPERENYKFLGWYDSPEDGEKLESYNGLTDINVYAYWELDKPTDFDVDDNDLLLVVGEMHQIDVTFTPDGTTDDLVYSGYNDEVISVVDGLITSLSPGETTIEIALESNEEVTKTINVKVVQSELTSSILDVETRELARIIIGEEPNTTLDDFLNKLDNDIEYISVYTEDDELIEDMDTIVATGMKIKLTVNGQVIDEAVIIIRGDIDGDGMVNIIDAGLMKQHIIEVQAIEGFRLYAADLDEDPDATINNMVNVLDSGKLKAYIIESIDSLNKKEGD